MAIIYDKDDSPKIEDLKTRGEKVKYLYNAAKKLFMMRDHGSAQVTFKEVFLNDKLRCDVLNITWNERVTVVELKTCRDDFEKDSKWKGYLDYCDNFYFMCPEGVIKKEELPKEIGLIYVTGGTLKNPFFHIVKGSWKLKPKFLDSAWFRRQFKKLLFRRFAKVQGELIELDDYKLFEK